MGAEVTDVGESFTDFVHVHGRSLFGTAYLLTGSATEAEELVQDTLVALFAKWHLVTAADSAVAYVRRALTNRFLDSRRAHAGAVSAMWQLPDGAADDASLQVVDRLVIWQLVGQLPPRQRAAIVLRFFHAEPDQQIAELLGCRPATVRSLISRALAAMRSAARDAERSTGPLPNGDSR